MADYTKRGHKLHHEKGLIFQCVARHVRWTNEKSFEQGADAPLAILQVIAPCSQGQLSATLSAWLSTYDDDELIAQVEAVVVEALAKIPMIKDVPPSVPPQKGQMTN
jgi:hypothetical protein